MLHLKFTGWIGICYKEKQDRYPQQRQEHEKWAKTAGGSGWKEAGAGGGDTEAGL